MPSCFKLDLGGYHISASLAPAGYDFISFAEEDVPASFKAGWEALLGRKWNVKKNTQVLFVLYKGEVVSTRYYEVYEVAKTSECHVAFTKSEHRQKGLWKFLIIKWLNIIYEMGIETAIATTSKPFLHPFFGLLGFKKGER